MRKSLFLALLLASYVVHADIQKWQDKNGVWHFSNQKRSVSQIKTEYKSEVSELPFKENLPAEKGSLTIQEVTHGRYYKYVGRNPSEKIRVIIINHGMFGKGKTEVVAAKQMIEPWFDLANKYGLTLIAPIFEDEAFSVTLAGAGNGGYRGLFGRDVNADDFLHEIIADYKSSVAQYDGRFFLVGHSAGAQFSNRYMVRHPERVIAAAYSAPAWFALPDPNLKWPLGMGRKKYIERWPGRALNKQIDITPNVSGWVKAVQIPTAIVVGELDLELLRHEENLGGDNHVERAKFWLASTNSFSRRHGVRNNQKLILVPSVGHEYRKLNPELKKFIEPFVVMR